MPKFWRRFAGAGVAAELSLCPSEVPLSSPESEGLGQADLRLANSVAVVGQSIPLLLSNSSFLEVELLTQHQLEIGS